MGKGKPIAFVICICGLTNEITVDGNNNADGKTICDCGRHITIHFRRNRRKEVKDAKV